MAVTRQNLIDRLNLMNAASAANPIKKGDFVQFLLDWLNYMTNDGQYSAGVLEQWKTETLALQNAKLNADITLANNAAAQALASAAMASLVAQGQATARPSTRPIFAVDFANSRFWDTRLTFSRTGGDIATYIDKLGVLRTAKGNTPRFTHDPVTKKCLGLMREEDRANLFTYSNSFSRTEWGKVRSNIVVDPNVLAPDGQPAQKLVEDTTANLSHQISRGDINATVGQKYSGSIAVMMAEKRYVQVQLSGAAVYGGTNPAANVDLLTGTIVQTFNCESASIERTALGYYMVTVTQTATVAGSTGINLLLLDDNKSLQYTGDGMSGAYIFNGQIELGSSSTSSIINLASTPTRGGDSILLTGTNYQKAIGILKDFTVLYSAKKMKSNYSFSSYFRISGDDTAGGQNYFKLTNNGANPNVYAEVSKNGVTTYGENWNNNAPFGSFFTHAVAISKTDSQGFSNGVAGANDADVSLPDNLNKIELFGNVNTIIAHFAIWNSRLTNAETLALTTTGLSGKNPNQVPTIADINRSAFVAPETILSSPSRQEFSVDCTGASITRNIRRPYAFTFEIIDSSGVTLTTQPSASCVENTDNSLVFTGPAGKTLTYAITPVFEY